MENLVSKMEVLVKIINFQLVTIFAKTFILAVRLALGCIFAQTYLLILHLMSAEYRKGLISRVKGLMHS